MRCWALTLPQRIEWADYGRELTAVADGKSVMNYRTARAPKDMKPGDRCYVVHRGRVRGWMAVTDVVNRDEPWTCSTTGAQWPAGTYVQRSGPFHPVEHDWPMQGFRGVRSVAPPEQSEALVEYIRLVATEEKR